VYKPCTTRISDCKRSSMSARLAEQQAEITRLNREIGKLEGKIEA
jgi:hypothetical protein